MKVISAERYGKTIRDEQILPLKAKLVVEKL